MEAGEDVACPIFDLEDKIPMIVATDIWTTALFSLYLELIGGPKFFPFLLCHQRLDLVAGQVDAVVEVAAPEYVIMTEQVPVEERFEVAGCKL